MSKPQDKPPGMSIMLVSYIPFLAGEAGSSIPIENAPALGAFIEQMPSGQAEACIWMLHEDKYAPVFMYPDAGNMIDHLVAWSEGDPTKWFDLHLKRKQSKYTFALIPKFTMSIDRHRMAYQLKNGLPLPKDTRYNILFRALHFVSGTDNMFASVRDKLPEDITIGFVDSSLINKDDVRGSVEKFDADAIRWVGPFKLAPNKVVAKFLDNILDDAKEPAQASLKF